MCPSFCPEVLTRVLPFAINRLNLANDAADMRETDDPATKKDIYYNVRSSALLHDPSLAGRHLTSTFSFFRDAMLCLLRMEDQSKCQMYVSSIGFLPNLMFNIIFATASYYRTKRSLGGLSLQSYPLMAQDALYNIFRHTFLLIGRDIEGEPEGKFDQQPVSEYADTLVNDLFELNISHIETEAAIILNVWMQIVHFLYEVMRACKSQDTDKMNASLDVAAALWIGADQPEGVSDQGNMMYNLAQIGAERFNQANGEAESNAKVINAMNDIQTKIAGGTCESDQGYVEVRDTINQLFGSMTIPLLQVLIHHIRQQPADGGANFIELYTLSFLPRVEACDPAVYKKLLQLLVRNSLQEADKDEAIGLLQSVYDCLGVTCVDIGSYESGEVPTCSDDEVNQEGLAGYSPATDIHPVSTREQ